MPIHTAKYSPHRAGFNRASSDSQVGVIKIKQTAY